MGRAAVSENGFMIVQPILPIAFTVQGAIAYTGLKRTRIYLLLQTGELPSLLIGGRRMIRRRDLDAIFA